MIGASTTTSLSGTCSDLDFAWARIRSGQQSLSKYRLAIGRLLREVQEPDFRWTASSYQGQPLEKLVEVLDKNRP